MPANTPPPGPATDGARSPDPAAPQTFTFAAGGQHRTLTMIQAVNRNGNAWAVIRNDAPGQPPAWATWTRTGPASWISTTHADRIEDEDAAMRWRPPTRPDGRYITAIDQGPSSWADVQHARITSQRGGRPAPPAPGGE
jgi:hypothetical protein